MLTDLFVISKSDLIDSKKTCLPVLDKIVLNYKFQETSFSLASIEAMIIYCTIIVIINISKSFAHGLTNRLCVERRARIYNCFRILISFSSAFP
jgi:hypothetical protein